MSESSPERQVAATLSDEALAALAERIGALEADGLALTGSYARGEATRYSDIDLLRFASTEPTSERERYRLSLLDGRLVSVTTTTILAKRAELARPESALWAVEGLRQARILSDRNGALAALLSEAQAFTWTPALRAAAAGHASETLAGLAEEVHKALGALERGADGALLYATIGLQQGLIRAALVAACTLLTSENDFFDAALRLATPDRRWSRLLRIVIGHDAPPVELPLARGRGIAALWLYVVAAGMLAASLTEEDCVVVAESVERIRVNLAKSRQAMDTLEWANAGPSR